MGLRASLRETDGRVQAPGLGCVRGLMKFLTRSSRRSSSDAKPLSRFLKSFVRQQGRLAKLLGTDLITRIGKVVGPPLIRSRRGHSLDLDSTRPPTLAVNPKFFSQEIVGIRLGNVADDHFLDPNAKRLQRTYNRTSSVSPSSRDRRARDDGVDHAALEVGGDVEAEEAEDRRRHVHELHAGDRAPAARCPGPVAISRPVGGVVGVVGAGVVLEGVDLTRCRRCRPTASGGRRSRRTGRAGRRPGRSGRAPRA